MAIFEKKNIEDVQLGFKYDSNMYLCLYIMPLFYASNV